MCKISPCGQWISAAPNVNYFVVSVGEDSYQYRSKMNWSDPEFNTIPSLGHKRRSVSIQLTRWTLIYKVIEIRVQISEIKFIKYENVTIWNDYYQYLKYDKNLGLGEYQCKETTLTLIQLNLLMTKSKKYVGERSSITLPRWSKRPKSVQCLGRRPYGCRRPRWRTPFFSFKSKPWDLTIMV